MPGYLPAGDGCPPNNDSTHAHTPTQTYTHAYKHPTPTGVFVQCHASILTTNLSPRELASTSVRGKENLLGLNTRPSIVSGPVSGLVTERQIISHDTPFQHTGERRCLDNTTPVSTTSTPGTRRRKWRFHNQGPSALQHSPARAGPRGLKTSVPLHRRGPATDELTTSTSIVLSPRTCCAPPVSRLPRTASRMTFFMRTKASDRNTRCHALLLTIQFLFSSSKSYLVPSE